MSVCDRERRNNRVQVSKRVCVCECVQFPRQRIRSVNVYSSTPLLLRECVSIQPLPALHLKLYVCTCVRVCVCACVRVRVCVCIIIFHASVLPSLHRLRPTHRCPASVAVVRPRRPAHASCPSAALARPGRPAPCPRARPYGASSS